MRTFLTILDFDSEDPLWTGQVPQVPEQGSTITFQADDGTYVAVKTVTQAHWAYGPNPHGPDAVHATIRALIVSE